MDSEGLDIESAKIQDLNECGCVYVVCFLCVFMFIVLVVVLC